MLLAPRASPAGLLQSLSLIPAGENLVPKSSVQDEEGAAREGAPRHSRTARGCRSDNSTVATSRRRSRVGKRREALYRGRQRTATTLNGPTPSPSPPSYAIVHTSSYTSTPPATTPARLVVVPVSYWW
jgi:hypothetical protein